MTTSQISADSYQLTRLGMFNCYLVREDDGWTLIDTTLSGAEDAILEEANKLNASIKRILLTHAHGDHVGAVDALTGKLPAGTELLCSERSVPLLKTSPDTAVMPGEPQGEIKGSLPGIATKPARLVREGERVGSLLVLETPGHIPGHLSFLDERDGTLFTGDALIAVGELRVSGDAEWYFPFPNLATWDKPLALKSARRLHDVPAQRYASGHGALREGGPAAVAEAIAHMEKAMHS